MTNTNLKVERVRQIRNTTGCSLKAAIAAYELEQVAVREKVDDVLKDRVTRTKELVNKFNKRYAGGTVYLSLNDEKDNYLYASFTIKFRFDDPFVDQEIYRSGSAYTYPSDALYLVLDVLAGDDKLNWNNTRSTGWLAYPESEAK